MQIDDFPAERRAPVSPPPQVIWPGSVQGRELRSAFLGLRANEYAGNRVVSAVFLFIPEKQKRKKKLSRAFNFSEGHTISEFLVFVILAQHQGYVPDNKQ